MTDIFVKLAKHAVVPVIAIENADDALPLADALLEGGLPVAEITFRTKAAAEVIAIIANKRPELLIGAGTVLTKAQVDAAQSAGARFALSPGISPNIVSYSNSKGLPFAPGIVSPSELQMALELNCKLVKFFPAMAAGGPNLLKNITAPYAHTGVMFNPTGGISMDNLADWLSIPQVLMVGGSWIATKKDIADKNWKQICDNARDAVSKVKELRG